MFKREKWHSSAGIPFKTLYLNDRLSGLNKKENNYKKYLFGVLICR